MGPANSEAIQADQISWLNGNVLGGMIYTKQPAPPASHGPSAAKHPVLLCSGGAGAQSALHNLRVDRPQRLLLLKLDHRGDFLIGLPALEKLRATFPDGHITLVCGSWNTTTVRDLGVADEIRTYDYFPENSHNWTGDAVEGVDRFREVCKGQFDIAVDLRVDEDTRPLLRHVDAALRCGIGSRARQPYLDIVLPAEFEARELRPVDTDTVVLGPDAFHSRMPIRTPFFHETDFSVTAAHLIYGPYTCLPAGRLSAEFAFQLEAPILWPAKVRITIEVARTGGLDVVARKRLKRVPKSGVTVIEVEFANSDPTARYEFRVFVGGHPWRSRLRFFGVRVHLLEKEVSGARYLPAELHIGEQLSLLVQLIAERVRPLYSPDLANRIAGRPDIGSPAPAGIPPSAKCIVVAPRSNSTVRDWPLDRYINLIGMLLAKVECYVVLVGSRDQLTSLNHICHQLNGDRRLVNLQIDWSELAGVLRRADLVIANNSGVAHLAAACGRPTLAIYSGSHQPQEWGPRGESVRTVTAAVPCSPCGYERLELCPHDHRCMTLIEPETIFRHAIAMLSPRPAQTEAGLDLMLRS
jgi:ADP-heptose:LPS heptosyltransferase